MEHVAPAARALGLVEAKEGCGEGECGACTIIVGAWRQRLPAWRWRPTAGRSRRSKVWPGPMAPASAPTGIHRQGRRAVRLHAPGMLLSAKALLDRNLDPSEDEVREAIAATSAAARATPRSSRPSCPRRPNFGPPPPGGVTAARRCRASSPPPPPPESPHDPPPVSAPCKVAVVGKEIPRPTPGSRVTAQARYIHDLELPGMLWGRIKYSDRASARIVSIDTSAAEAMPGVKAVITAITRPSCASAS